MVDSLKIMQVKVFLVAAIIAAFAAAASAQGGKAEPKRIKYAAGKTSTVATGTLSNNQEMDHVFNARAGQTVTLRVSSKPRGNFFDFSIAGSNFEFETEYDRYSECSFTAPVTGDYLVFVRKRPTDTVKRAKFSLTLSIK